jgi:ketosteroid isomerase-like protein
MADTARNKELVLEFWATPPAGKGACLTDDATWHLPGSVGRKFGTADLHGEQAKGIFVASTEVYEPGGAIDVLHVLAEDDLVTLHCTLHARTRAGHDYHGSYHMLFRVEDDRIAEVWEFLDTAYLAECVEPATDA